MPKQEKPPIQTTKSGVHKVRPADILNSKVGRDAITQTYNTIRSKSLPVPEPKPARNAG